MRPAMAPSELMPAPIAYMKARKEAIRGGGARTLMTTMTTGAPMRKRSIAPVSSHEPSAMVPRKPPTVSRTTPVKTASTWGGIRSRGSSGRQTRASVSSARSPTAVSRTGRTPLSGWRRATMPTGSSIDVPTRSCSPAVTAAIAARPANIRQTTTGSLTAVTLDRDGARHDVILTAAPEPEGPP